MGRHICLNGIGLNEWGGGRDFLTMLVDGITAPNVGHKDELSLLLPLGNVLWGMRKEVKDGIWRIRNGDFPPSRSTFKRTIKHLSESNNEETIRVLQGRLPGLPVIYSWNDPRSISQVMERNVLDVLLPLMNPPGKGLTKPWVGYMFDLQHRVHPEFFSQETIASRDDRFSRLVKEAKVIIVNSRTVGEEAQRYFPSEVTNYVVLPFTPKTPQEWFDEASISTMKEKYHLDQRYFIISNQFWAHKDHLTAFRALKEADDLDRRMRRFHIVCTGSTDDYRFPEHYPMLVREIERMGLKDRIHILGHVPKHDQLALLNGAEAVVQATLYEGGPGGGAVYDAISYGVPAIVSDIPINREIEEGDITFFRVGSSSDLAKRMIERLDINSDRASREALMELGRERAARLHVKLDEAIELAMSEFRV